MLKILHGSDSDIAWLRRYFDLQLINIFDTHTAAVECAIQPASLAHLLHLYCDAPDDVFATKAAMQTSDWSARPLSRKQLAYAVQDVWYLPYIAAQLVLRLDEHNLQRVVHKSQLGTLGTRRNVSAAQDPTAMALVLLTKESTIDSGSDRKALQTQTNKDVRGTAARVLTGVLCFSRGMSMASHVGTHTQDCAWRQSATVQWL